MNKRRRFSPGLPLLRKVRTCLFLSALCLFAASPGLALDLEKKVSKTVLDNGITLLVMERHVSPTVSLHIQHRAGAVDEDSGYTGAAHLLEHMMFKGTRTIGTSDYEAESLLRRRIEEMEKRLEITLAAEGAGSEATRALEEKMSRLAEEKRGYIRSNEIDRLYREQGGVGLNAATGYDMTSYIVNLPSNSLELWARIESDRLLNPVFREFIQERNVVIEERRQVVDSRPERQLMELFLAAAFIAHPYGRPIIGWPSDIPRIGRNHLRHFFATRYRPSGMVITIVGDVRTDEAISLVRQYFGPLGSDPGPGQAPRNITHEPPQRGERRTTLRSNASPHLLLGFHKPAFPAYEDAVFDILELVLAGGRSSRLYRSLVTERGIAASVRASNGFPGARYDNLFVIAAEPMAGRDLAELEAALYNELDRLKEEPLTERDLRKAKNRITTDYLRRFDSNSGIARLLSYAETLTGDFRTVTTYLETVESITAEDVMEAASSRFTPSNRTVATLVKDGFR